MANEKLSSLKKLLPPQYASLISKKLLHLSIEAKQVRGVFAGTCNDPNVIVPVLEEANKLKEAQEKANKLIDSI